jgi:hypothetical protein
VSAAILDDLVGHALRWRLVQDKSDHKKMFDPDGALGSFEPKVRLGYLLGVYGSEAKDNLLAIASVRNRLAHFAHIRHFEDTRLDPFFKKITIYKYLPSLEKEKMFPKPIPANANRRTRFTAAANTLTLYLARDPFHHAPVMAFDPKF